MSFGRRIPKPTQDEAEREERARRIGCICCYLNALEGWAKAPSYDTKQHCNVGGLHGAPNRGERFTYIGCAWHHLGTPPPPLQSPRQAGLLYGPSFFHHKRAFRERYGSDDDLILLTDQLTGFQP